MSSQSLTILSHLPAPTRLGTDWVYSRLFCAANDAAHQAQDDLGVEVTVRLSDLAQLLKRDQDQRRAILNYTEALTSAARQDAYANLLEVAQPTP